MGLYSPLPPWEPGAPNPGAWRTVGQKTFAGPERALRGPGGSDSAVNCGDIWVSDPPAHQVYSFSDVTSEEF